MTTVVPRAVALAREWLGTPYVHQASCKGAGCDCLGLIRGIWRELYGQEPEQVPGYTRDWSEATGEEALWEAGARLMNSRPVGQVPSAGDVLLFRMRTQSVAKHIGLYTGAGHFIHSYEGCGVVEVPLSKPWARRVVARFELP